MKVQCACGGAYVGWSKRMWLIWLQNHVCPAAESEPESTSEDDDEHGSFSYGDSHVERSFQYNGQWDGERHLPEINAKARQPIGFHVT